MNSVLEKLASLTLDESSKLIGVRKQLRFLHDELNGMCAALEDVAGMESPNNQTMAWRNEVRELSYDIEDCIDDFRDRVEDPHDAQGLIRKALHFLETMMPRYQMARKFEELKTRVQEASDRRARYRLDECMSRSVHVDVDPRIPTFFTEASSLVGIDGPKEEIIKMLTKVDDSSLQQLRVVSIMGFGGLGKTTLANEVYHKLGESYSCKAFISVSQRPDMMSLLKSLFSKVSDQKVDNTDDLRCLIGNLREYLQGKRYIIVVDDLWDELAWQTIKCAISNCHCGSVVLTTTRIERVAMACCNNQREFVYNMKPLDDYNSKQLFLRRVFGLGTTWPETFEEPGDKILKKCGGLPLAIITIASLLASQPSRSTGQWDCVLNSLPHNLRSNPTLEGMRHIVNLSYTHLPHHLKTCLLYIGIYPEDYEIERDDLVMQWVAEGFISGVDRRDAMEVAGSYLNELVNRSMIIQHVNDDFLVRSFHYKVHDMVLDLILSKSREENFFCAVQNLQAISTGQHQYKARRLSLQFGDARLVKSAARISLPHVRSLIIFGFPLRSLGQFELKFLRVLYVESDEDLELTSIGKLFQLRYLCIRSSGDELQLPREISGLRKLETLIMLSGCLSVVPQDIVYLPALSYLELPTVTAYPDGIGNMQSLHTLRGFEPMEQSVDNIRALGELLNLRVLDMWIDDDSLRSKEPHMDALLSSLEKLINCSLRILAIATIHIGDKVGSHDKWSSLCFSGSRLEQLGLDFWFPRIPVWVRQLEHLSSLEIKVKKLSKDDVAALAGLPSLLRLKLYARDVPDEGVVFSSDAPFKVLTFFFAPYSVAEVGLTFQAEAMPKLETLNFQLDADKLKLHGVKLAGIEHLPNLKKVNIRLFDGKCDESDILNVQAAIKSAFDVHPARPSIRIF